MCNLLLPSTIKRLRVKKYQVHSPNTKTFVRVKPKTAVNKFSHQFFQGLETSFSGIHAHYDYDVTTENLKCV